MAIVDVVYDVVSGVLGTLFGVAVTLLATRRRTQQTNNILLQTQKKVDALSNENIRLINVLRDKENLILELEKKILNAEKSVTVKKTKRGK